MLNLKKMTIAALVAAVVFSSIGIDSAEASSRHYRGNAAAVGAVIGLFGVIAAAAAADSYRDRYYGRPYYGYGPYAHGPGYGYGYAPRYRYRHYRHRGYWR